MRFRPTCFFPKASAEVAKRDPPDLLAAIHLLPTLATVSTLMLAKLSQTGLVLNDWGDFAFRGRVALVDLGKGRDRNRAFTGVAAPVMR
jgi:hypothetical protein